MPRHKAERILVVDDSPDTLEVIRRNLSAVDYDVVTVSGVAEALRALDSTRVDIVITDLRMPKVSGLDLVRHVRENRGDVQIIMITGYASVPGAVEAMRTGAHEYLAKPFTDAELLAAVGRAVDRLRLRRPVAGRAQSAPADWGLLGESEKMRAAYRAITKAAKSSATVLILGESGTGKELVARAIHYSSSRASAPLVPVNCGGIPDGLLESELFGSRKGAFTGAHESRAGFFQTAEAGSIFLDEIAELTLPMQAALLRVLQDKVVFMVGSRQSRKVDVRVMAATNKNLESLVEKGAFREDLYYRINVVPIVIPPLREREDDVILLVHHFAARFAKEQEKPSPRFSDRLLAILRAYPWPGNVRELENIVQRLVLMAERNVIDAPDLPDLMRFSAARIPAKRRTLDEVASDHVRAVLVESGGNKSRAAAILGIDRKTLREKLKTTRQSAR
ncbi:MAG: sigma-54-dependent Fis family transcriptional regulator [Planctomycetia bacterium]|nr:sigma-54-dependent Fis family transcriptional regulator [Planctomycetia bacterium]